MYTLEEFAKLVGLSKDTIRLYDDVLQPLRTPGGHRRYTDEHLAKLYRLGLKKGEPTLEAVAYARVSSKAQQSDLQQQVEALLSFASARGIHVDEVIKDIGSSVNFKRSGLQKLVRLLVYQRPKYLLIATRDRLARIGYDVVAELCRTVGTEILVLYDDLEADNYDPVKQTVEELVHIVHYYAMRLYGQRSYKRVKQLEEDVLNAIGSDHPC